MQTHANSTLCNPVTLTCDLLTSGSMHDEVLHRVYKPAWRFTPSWLAVHPWRPGSR